MSEYSPEQLAKKFRAVLVAVREQEKTAIAARAAVTKAIVTTAAEGTGARGRRWGRRWIKSNLLGKDTANVRLTSGFGFLTELGSYKASASGWDEEPRKGAGALAVPPYGFFAKVDHPPERAHPFWRGGVDAARIPGQEAWAKSMRNSILKAVR